MNTFSCKISCNSNLSSHVHALAQKAFVALVLLQWDIELVDRNGTTDTNIDGESMVPQLLS